MDHRHFCPQCQNDFECDDDECEIEEELCLRCERDRLAAEVADLKKTIQVRDEDCAENHATALDQCCDALKAAEDVRDRIAKELDAERQDHGITKGERDGLRRVLVMAMEILWALDASVEWELCDEIKLAIKAAIAAEKQLANK